MIEIRVENEKDYNQVKDVLNKAFNSAERSDRNEVELYDSLKNSDSYIPELSLVATDDGKIVGYVLFSKVNVGNSEEIALEPIAVLPDYQGKGIGGKLIREGHKKAKDLGYHYSLVYGDEYYPKFGYVPSMRYEIIAPVENSNKKLFAFKLDDENNKIKGKAEFAEEFGF